MITDINPVLLIDGYKADHRRQYPEGTEYVYSNLTPRMSRVPEVVFKNGRLIRKQTLKEIRELIKSHGYDD